MWISIFNRPLFVLQDSANRVIPGQQGEFVIKLQSGSLFSVSSFRGNENLNYMCVQGCAVEVYHIGLVPVPSSNPPLRLYGCVLPSHVQSTIYPTPPNLTINQSVGKKATNREMVSIAVQVKSLPERKVKVQRQQHQNKTKTRSFTNRIFKM